MRILAGPDNWSFFTKYWRKGLADQDLVFFCGGRGSIQYNADTATFQDILARLPEGWEPDLVIWWLPEHQPVLPGLVDCPYPTMAQVSHWHTISDALLPQLAQFDLVATDRVGVRLVGPRAFEAPLYGFDPDQHKRLPDCERIFDVTHAGDLNPFLHDQKLATLARAAVGLGSQFKLRYFSDLAPDDYTRVLNQSRITLDTSESSMRAYEALACGSLLFCREGGPLQDRRYCVHYNQDNLVDLLRYYLEHEEERAALAEAGHAHVQQFSYQRQGQRLIELAQAALAQGQTKPRSTESVRNYLCSIRMPLLPKLAFEKTMEGLADDPEGCNQRGCVEAMLGDRLVSEQRWGHLQAAADSFSQALSLGLMVRLSLAQALLRAFRKDLAAEVLLEAVGSEFREVAFFPRRLGALHTLWEREPQNREATARWQLFELLSQLVPDRCVEFCRLALAQRPDMATTWFRLGLRQKPGSPERLKSFQRAAQAAPTFTPALFKLAQEQPDPAPTLQSIGHLRAAFADLQPLKKRPKSNPEPAGSLEEFLAGISFDWLLPAHPVPPLLSERAGSELEYVNTYFAHDDERIKQRFGRLESVPRMSTLAISAILNRVVADMPPDQAFVNVGIWHGFTLLSALLDNPDKRCIGIDNFSQFGGPKQEFLERFERLRGPAHSFHELDYRVYFEQQPTTPLGVYLYDGEHSYANQLQGLQVAEPYFAKGCIVLVDDTNWKEPRQASLDFIEQSSRRYQLLLDARSAANSHPTWWNGFMVFRCLE